MITRLYSQIGTVTYAHNSKAKRIIVKVKPDTSVWVTLPLFAEIEKAEKFLLSRVDWICKAQKKVSNQKNQQRVTTEDSAFTHFHSIAFVSHKSDKLSVSVNDSNLTVLYPDSLPREHSTVQDYVSLLRTQALRVDAYMYIEKRLEVLSEQCQLPFKSVKITSARTRWGSCSYNNNINASYFIMQLPFHLIDFVLIHELCHTIHKNHGKEFHELLNKCVDGKERDYTRELRQYSIV
ncbi:MAG: DUF45 domain-containing protein [Bacteroidales bacterium]|jgi:predicted metal-dependent hydrolase|nr:DUF45 domain-containing protein [Bacteroidales bacterium]